jgi:uncharacterized protein (TIGR02145 family)
MNTKLIDQVHKVALVQFFTLLCILNSYAQRDLINLTFSAVDSIEHIQLDSIKIMNRTQGEEQVLYWPDTSISIEINPDDLLLYVGYSTKIYTAVKENDQCLPHFEFLDYYPNPVKDHIFFSLNIPDFGTVELMATTIQGSNTLKKEFFLMKGINTFKFTPGGSPLYILTAKWNGIHTSMKIINTGAYSGIVPRFDHIGCNNSRSILKTPAPNSGQMRESGILDNPTFNKSYIFQFDTNIPCLGIPTVEYEGRTYNTIQIFSQCWLKENLNVGEMINGSVEQSNNGIIEKYCYNNEPDSCNIYGGLYLWEEMMQYTTQQGTQGICPQGWHLPTDEEWKVLEGAVDSQYGIGDQIWEGWWGYHGFDVGTNLKTNSGWHNGGNGTDKFGFSALPCGQRKFNGSFTDVGEYSFWWTSSESEYGYYNAWWHAVFYNESLVFRGYEDYYYNPDGTSVSCIKDN